MNFFSAFYNITNLKIKLLWQWFQKIIKTVSSYLHIDYQFLLFLIVGGINTIFGYSVFALFIFVGLHYALAALVSSIVGVLFNFKTTGILVFKNHDNQLISKFISVYVVIYLINIIALKQLNSYCANMYYAGALLILPLAFCSFFLNKKYVF